MNDIRNLMDNLHTQMEYREFDGATRPPNGAWPILQHVGRMAPPVPIAEDAHAEEAEAEPIAARAPRAPLVSGLRRPDRSMLDRYAPAETSPDDGRGLPLAEVFAQLAQPAR
ncbi:hypothetical protein LJR219_002512 [Phenylobacterium sp. LjRoot219]|uniref:hypothetical protein n=1 Tax=Phenylobacterium sp. LjRoot219 TaxID=3342283 RepID=UPI003ED0C6FA